MSPQTGQTAKRTWVVPVVILALTALLIAMIVAFGRGFGDSGMAADSSAAEGPAQVEDSEGSDLTFAERRDPDDLLAAGPVDAPVTLIVFSDYQCPFCARWSHETLPSMMEHVEAGDLRIEWRDVNVFGPASERAARASYAAALQGGFWEYHDALFEGGAKRSEAELSDHALIELAGELGLDTEQFAADMVAEPTAEQIAQNERLGLDLGAHSTPMFLMGGLPMVGAQPAEVFEDAFEQALAKAE